jgi:hypothetical protein
MDNMRMMLVISKNVVGLGGMSMSGVRSMPVQM